MTTPTIWDDLEVQQIFDLEEGRPILRSDRLDGGDQLLAELWILKDSAVDDDQPADTFSTACFAGVSAVERFTEAVPAGWSKLIVYRVGNVAWGLWEGFRDPRAASLLDWAVVTMNDRGWAPDGNASALGVLHGGCLAAASDAGGGVRVNPNTKQFESPTGERARELASEWYMDWAMGDAEGWLD